MENALPQHLYCELEYQEADVSTGRTRMTVVCPKTRVIKRRSGIELVSESPPLRKAVRLQSDSYEVYFRYVKDGKAALIRRDATRTYQFNLRYATPRELADLVAFSIRLGAIAKSPLPSLQLQPAAAEKTRENQHQHHHNNNSSKRSASGELLTRRRPLQDRSNTNSHESPPPSPSASTSHKRRRVTETRSSSSSSSSPTPSGQRLTADQRRVIAQIAAQRNVFFTGSAGTGKSYLLQQILSPHGPLHAYLRGKRVYATATTGIAAYNINGMTLHHFAGLDTRVDLRTVSATQLATQIKTTKKDALLRWRTADVLVIDEISMLDGRLFDALEQVARELRPSQRDSFFGGIQLVLSGDFFQLPPVVARAQRDDMTLCFESLAWQRGVQQIVELTQIFRQTNTAFVELLNAFRVGKPTRAMVEQLNTQCVVDTENSDDSDNDAIRIFTHNSDVQETNDRRLHALAGRKYNYVAADTGPRKEYLSSCPATPTLALKKHAHVMLIKSINPLTGLVNGCRGVVVDFTPQTQLPIVKFATGATEIVHHEDFPVRVADAVLATRRQLPLALAWAISIHKSQGLSFPRAVLDLSRVFEFGQAYVALSRIRSLEGLTLRKRLDERRLVLADSRVLRFYQHIQHRSSRDDD